MNISKSLTERLRAAIVADDEEHLPGYPRAFLREVVNEIERLTATLETARNGPIVCKEHNWGTACPWCALGAETDEVERLRGVVSHQDAEIVENLRPRMAELTESLADASRSGDVAVGRMRDLETERDRLRAALEMLRGHLRDYIPPNLPWKGPAETAVEYIDQVLARPTDETSAPPGEPL